MKINMHSSKKIAFLSLAVLVGIASCLVILEKMNVTHFFHKDSSVLKVTSKTPTTGGASSSSQKGEVSNTNQSSGSSSSQPGDQKSNDGGSSTALLISPSGNFVSNHRPNLSGSPAPNTMSSVCTTTAGAQCAIAFTQGAVTKSLPSITTDREGSAYWNWKLQDIGLTTGSWQIRATATLNGQTKTTTDAMELVVSQ